MTITKTAIQWTHLPGRDDGYSANPIRFRDRETGEPVTWACVKVSQGCSNCYAEALALRYGKGDAYTVPNMAKLEPVLDEKVIHEMLTSRKISGAAVFLGDMTDLFGEWVPDEMLDRIFAVMALRADVIWQLLTKRPERMRAYMSAPDRAHLVTLATWDHDVERFGAGYGVEWPLPNCWLGTSVEDQAAADERIPHLLATPAAVRFLSCEPLLGPVDLTVGHEVYSHYDRPSLLDASEDWCALDRPNGIDQVIFGGESGPRARPCNIEWIRDGVRQCQAADVPAYVKQLGGKPYQEFHQLQRAGCGAPVGLIAPSEAVSVPLKLRSRHGSDPAEWPDTLRVREFPERSALD